MKGLLFSLVESRVVGRLRRIIGLSLEGSGGEGDEDVVTAVGSGREEVDWESGLLLFS
jgi:hypothetical protein